MKTVMVLGMHRSGTSVVAKAISLLGVEFGENLLEAKPDNKKGFWEDAFVVSCNDQVLKQSLHEWYTVGKINTVLGEKKSELINYLKENFKHAEVWGIKDPRLCRLLPEWDNILNSLNFDIKYCVAIRNPLSVIKSLEHRNEFTAQHAELLWYQYNIDILKNLQNKCFSVVDYDEIIKNPKDNVYRLGKGFSLSDRIEKDKIEQFCEIFLTKKLRNSSYTLNDLQNDTSIHDDVKKLYKFMLSLTQYENVKISQVDINYFISESYFAKEIERGQNILNVTFKKCFSLKERLSHTESSLNIAKTHLDQTFQERDFALNECQKVNKENIELIRKHEDLKNSGSLLLKSIFNIIKNKFKNS
jgi:hypothetical protein